MYKECLRNHAASLGSYATDGCGEYTPEDSSPDGSLHCAACGCHRNFHRKVTYSTAAAAAVHEGGGMVGGGGGRGLLLAAPGAFTDCCRGIGGDHHHIEGSPAVESPSESDRSAGGGSGGGRKRFRTKFTQEQKDKMLEFAEKIGWKVQRKELQDEIERFCRSVGVSRQVFKVWMHNHKNSSYSSSASTGNASSLTG
ncbi:hypothetical protein SAY86_016381 [Trapa natans]|uniref:ZF-HD dimerization-type domain-containing protein n=1 Tax=Trapa natans TaxID=22666 RepID=A0AAN7LDJ2_TRANT|nr:hypothetical protein SAY86_016381 [Trapa natans]